MINTYISAQLLFENSWMQDPIYKHELTVMFSNVWKHSQSLHSFSKSHFISQNTIYALIVQIEQPVHTLQLVLFQSSIENRGLRSVFISLIGLFWRLTICINFCGNFESFRNIIMSSKSFGSIFNDLSFDPFTIKRTLVLHTL